MRGRDGFEHNLVSNVVVVNLTMFCTLMKSIISSDKDIGLIIIIHGHRQGNEILRSSRNDRSHTISLMVSTIARYSNSTLEHDTTFFF